ncbi:MAG: GAF domain-containing protein [Bacteroidales bacterium]|nr:GAF domain-containing protein [Bacteroidales bacterium]MCF8456013.1 GAF domain-containing protein [Bacteroidales bacterium]
MDQSKKEGRYSRIVTQLESLLQKTNDPYARMATICAVLNHKMDYFFWTGFYFMVDGEMTVQSYQGPLACQILEKDKGVCWAGFNQRKTLVVPDVEKFPDHIACDSRSKSEIVVPVFDAKNEIVGVLDVDSDNLNSFDDLDATYLEKIVGMIFQKKHFD